MKQRAKQTYMQQIKSNQTDREANLLIEVSIYCVRSKMQTLYFTNSKRPTIDSISTDLFTGRLCHKKIPYPPSSAESNKVYN